jgi:hypothetical protein
MHDQLAAMDAQQLREFAAGLIERVACQEHELRHKQLKIEQLTQEMALLSSAGSLPHAASSGTVRKVVCSKSRLRPI